MRTQKIYPSRYGVKIYGIPYRDKEYIKEELKLKGERLAHSFTRIREKMGAKKYLEPRVPAKQNLW